MRLTAAQRRRRSAIIAEIVEAPKDGRRKASFDDYRELEEELEQLNSPGGKNG